MESENFIKAKVKEQGILPLFYDDDLQTCLAVTKALYEAGIRCIEFTNRGANALVNFTALLKERDANMPGLLLGIGTIKTAGDASRFIQAGADFLVSPVFDAGICDVAYISKVLWIPGCMTPTEIHVAQQAGCTLIKLFPGNLLQPAFAEAIRPLFSGLDFIVTGGVDATKESMESWFNAGVTVVGMGSKLITQNILQAKDYAALKQQAGNIVKLVKELKAGV